MKVVAIAIVRNEADILAVNVRYHLASGVDSFLVVDNGSEDGTDRVLAELARDRRVRWSRDAGPYRQPEIFTALARDAFREGATWVVPIDADEFWWSATGDLRAALGESPAAALRAQVLNFIQRRDQIESRPEGLLHMTRRTPLPIGPLERVRERVESGRNAYVQMMYQPKWIFRSTETVEVAMGNHAVGGVDGPRIDTDEIVCFHALLRSRAALEAKVEQGRRVEELGLDANQGWHVRRWKRLSETDGLDREWRANSYEDDTIDVYGTSHPVVFDPRLRDLVEPWIPSASRSRRHAEAKGTKPATSRDDEVDRLLKTVHGQLSAHRKEQTASAALREQENAERDRIITGLQSELAAKVGERDQMIRDLQSELAAKVGERDGMIRDLQVELHSKVAERDAMIRELQAGGRSSAGGPPPDWAELGEKLREIAGGLQGLQSVRAESLESDLRRERAAREARDEQLHAARLELQRQASLERRLRFAEAELAHLENERHRNEEEVARLERERLRTDEELARLRPLPETLLRNGAALERASAELRELRPRLQDAERGRRDAEATSLQNAEELVRIHRSRLWRLACLYWRVAGWLRGSAAPASVPADSAVATAVPEPARSLVTIEALPAEPAELVLPAEVTRPEPPSAESIRIDNDTPPAESPEPPPAPAGAALPAVEERPDPGLPWGNKFDVLCLPIIDWNFRFQRPQQLMSRFAESGHRVFYVAPWLRTSGAPYVVTEIRPKVFEVSFRGPERNVYTDVLDESAREALMEGLNAVRRDYGFGATVSFVQLPFWSGLAIAARESYGWPIVYDCMDHHAGFSTNRPEMLAQEERLFQSADLIVTTSSRLEEEAARHNANHLVLRNACDFGHFARSATTNGPRPVIGYYGAIADWFDSDLMADLALRRPDWDFVLVGDTFTADTERLRVIENVRFVGEKPYAEIPEWLAGFDVAVIPFKRIPLTEATNPVKAYEILAAGKPLVSVPLPEMVLLEPLVRLASDAAEFEAQIAAALDASDWRSVTERRSFARENTWQSRLAALLPRLTAVFPRVSIVVVTYNNLDLTMRCLESVYERTEWPNFEVIVVDNASTDGTAEFLREAHARWPDLQVILNSENDGFARACNLGLERASGDYFVLLNNDTVVSRGWLSALVRHLHRDPTIGIIGPVTNAIGNEAMVAVGYENVDDMPRWAASFVHERDGQSIEIPMLAMFCVAMRRSVYETVGRLDERFGIGMFEDDDYSLRVRQVGYRIVCAEDSFVHHSMKASFSLIPPDVYQELFERNRRLFEEKWGTVWVPHVARRPAPPAVGDHDAGGRIRGSVTPAAILPAALPGEA